MNDAVSGDRGCFDEARQMLGDAWRLKKKGDLMAGMESGLSYDEAHALLVRYNKDPYHIKHGEQVGALMRYYAEKHDADNAEFWEQVGLLHDLDWEQWPDEKLHTVKTAELLAEAGADPALVKSIQTHNSDLNPDLPRPELMMEKVLYAVDELSGLINAAIIMRPSKSVTDFTAKSLKKKFKDKRFAAGCDRTVIQHGADLLDMELSELFTSVIEAEKSMVDRYDCFE